MRCRAVNLLTIVFGDAVRMRYSRGMKELITTAIVIPFILVSTWFGISAVNYHFDAEKRASIAEQQADRDEKVRLERQCFVYGKQLPGGDCYLETKP